MKAKERRTELRKMARAIGLGKKPEEVKVIYKRLKKIVKSNPNDNK